MGKEKNGGEKVCETFGMDGHSGAQFGFGKGDLDKRLGLLRAGGLVGVTL